MGITKTDLFTKDQNTAAKLSKAFAHPARVAIVQHLIKENKCINSHLVNELGLAQATVSQHLKELKNAGVIKGTIEGASISYCLNIELFIAMKSNLEELLKDISSKNDCGTDCNC